MSYPTYYPQYAPQMPYQPFRADQGQAYPQAPQMAVQAAQPPAAGQTVGFLTRPVTSKEEALGIPVDFFAPGTIMPDLAHGKIYLKKFNQNTGAGDLFVFALETQSEEQPPEVQYASRQDVESIREDLDRIFDELDRLRKPLKGGKRNDDE